VLTTITDKKIPVESNGQIDYYVADITSATDYYPFGSPMDGRNFSSDKYRFGFNGQEKDDEVAGAGNTNTAMFWEYDTRLGRRWNLDPKPDASISNYACFRNSPIFIIDLFGDTTYVNGELYTPGSTYSGTDKNTARAFDELNKLNTTKIGSEMLKSLCANPDDVNITATSGNPKDKSFLNTSSGDITWNMDQDSWGLDEKFNDKNPPSVIVIGHELAHKWDLLADKTNKLLGVKGTDEWQPLSKEVGESIYNSEKFACHIENIIRSEMKLPLRTHYYYSVKTFVTEWTGEVSKGGYSTYFKETIKVDAHSFGWLKYSGKALILTVPYKY
jgi:hypothetical protein